MRILFALMLLAALSACSKPHRPSVDVTGRQMMYLTAPSEHKFSEILGEQILVEEEKLCWKVTDPVNRVTYHVLKEGHAAYPGFVAHELIEEGTSVTVRQTGRFVGDEKAYDAWVNAL